MLLNQFENNIRNKERGRLKGNISRFCNSRRLFFGISGWWIFITPISLYVRIVAWVVIAFELQCSII